MLPIIAESVKIILLTLFQLFKATWWIFLPVVLFFKVKPLLLLSRRIKYASGLNWTVLEVLLPAEVEKTPKAMENVLVGMHGVWSPIATRQKWFQGEVMDMFSLELVGTNGELHFYIRCQQKQRNFVEAKIYSQYPDAEIREAGDYTEDLPPDIPGREYDIWGAEYMLNKNWVYPLETYEEFYGDDDFERVVDPLSQFAELVSKMEHGEHIWVQFVISPVLTEVAGEADKERDKIIGRTKPEKPGTGGEIARFVGDVGRAFGGKEFAERAEGKPSEPGTPQKLAPHEKMMLEKIERKGSKLPYNVSLRGIYLARSDVFHGEHIAGMQGFFRQFGGFNSMRPHPDSHPKKTLIFFKKQRNFIRKRRTMIAYKGRFLGFHGEPMVLTTDEIATMYHFPGRTVRAPFMPRVPSKTSEPPRGLPT